MVSHTIFLYIQIQYQKLIFAKNNLLIKYLNAPILPVLYKSKFIDRFENTIKSRQHLLATEKCKKAL